jgi:hypothetical protein
VEEAKPGFHIRGFSNPLLAEVVVNPAFALYDVLSGLFFTIKSLRIASNFWKSYSPLIYPPRAAVLSLAETAFSATVPRS